MRPALLTAIVLLALGCQPAHRFPPAAEKKTAKLAPPRGAAFSAITASEWLPPSRPVEFDPPIRFVSSSELRWNALPGFWNRYPPPGTGSATLHLGLDPLGAAVAVIAGENMAAIDIKVPKHLGAIPIDPVNPPTLGSWTIGRKIFFAPVLAGNKACSDCHRPERAFTDKFANSIGGRRTISLIDVAVRTPLFWDGRAVKFEETPGPARRVEGASLGRRRGQARQG